VGDSGKTNSIKCIVTFLKKTEEEEEEERKTFENM